VSITTRRCCDSIPEVILIRSKTVYSVLALLLVLAGTLGACSSDRDAGVTSAPPVGNTGSIETASPNQAGEFTAQPSGSSMTLSIPESSIDGLVITVPADAYRKPTEMKVTYAPVEDHSFGANFNPVSPLISIENGEALAAEPVELTIPVEVADDEFAMAFFYDDEQGTLEGLPLLSRDTTSITVATRHFSSVIVSAVNTALLYSDIDSGFRPGVDDWQFANRGSYLMPGGHCSGQTTTALWYYVTKPDGPGETLYNRYDNNGWEPASPRFWYDDSLGYRFASVVQLEDDYDGKLFNLTQRMHVLHQETWYLFAYSIMVTGEPQFVGIVSSAGGGHAMVVYRVNQGTLHVADPNYPGRTDRVIEFANGRFTPYNSGANAEAIERGQGKAYDQIFYVAKTAWVDWDRVADRWTEFKTLTIGDDVFPTYRIDRLDDQGNYVPLTDGYETSESIIKLSLYSPLGAKSRFDVSRDGQWLTTVPVIGAAAAGFQLEEGNNRLGVYISGQIPDGRYKYIDFKYFNIVYNPETEVPAATPTSTPTGPTKVWKLAEVVLPELPEMPVQFNDQFGSHSWVLTVTEDSIISDTRTAGPNDTEKGSSIFKVFFSGIPDTVVLGDEPQMTATWDFTVSGEARYTSGMVELRRGDFQGQLKRITIDQNPQGTLVFEWTPSGDEFEVTARLATHGDVRIKWIYRLE